MAFPINDDVSIAPVPLMSSYGSAGDLSSAFHPYRSVDPKEYEPRCGKTPSSPWR